MARQALHMPGAIRGYRRSAKLVDRGDGWAMLVSPAHGFGIVIHHVTLRGALAELEAAGFAEGTEVFDLNGEPVEADAVSGSPWLHLLARTPPAAS
jgi:hypothetical protein